MRRSTVLLLSWALGTVLAACSSSSDGAGGSSSGGAADASTSGDSGGGADDGSTASDGGSDGTTACEGACSTTALVATFGAKSGPLDRAQHGVDHGDVADTLHVEAHHGGDPACPNQSSPTPDRTFIVSGVPVKAPASATLTEKDGVTAAFLDFKGDVLPSVPLTKAAKVTVKVTAVDAASPPKWAAFDVDATFAEGTVKGHVYASHCASLDD
jgi:hypothetical protein